MEERTRMDDFEEALRNIDVFCKVLAKKMTENDDAHENIIVEPMEKLLQRKYIIEEHFEPNPINKNFIPLPHLEEPLIDVFNEDNYVKILMQSRCKDQPMTIHTNMDGLEICKKECYKNDDGTEVCTDTCKKLNLPVSSLQVNSMVARCNNNKVLEIDIPKKPAVNQSI